MNLDNRLMQGFERMDREFTDAELLARHLVPAGSMIAFLAAHRVEVFPDADYVDLFAAFGRPSLPATRMAAILALQSLHDLPDRETAEAVRFDVRWKVARGLAIDDAGFDPSSLVYWRGGSRSRNGRTGSTGDPADRGADRGAEGPAAPAGDGRSPARSPRIA
jgi:hypothetical protein